MFGVDGQILIRDGRNPLHCSDKPIALAGKCLNVARSLRRVAESVAESLDSCVQADVKAHEGVHGPELLAKFIASDHVTGDAQAGTRGFETADPEA